jgi:hypothetical protein
MPNSSAFLQRRCCQWCRCRLLHPPRQRFSRRSAKSWRKCGVATNGLKPEHRASNKRRLLRNALLGARCSRMDCRRCSLLTRTAKHSPQQSSLFNTRPPLLVVRRVATPRICPLLKSPATTLRGALQPPPCPLCSGPHEPGKCPALNDLSSLYFFREQIQNEPGIETLEERVSGFTPAMSLS